MKHHSAHPTREVLAGTLRVFLADMMILPTGLAHNRVSHTAARPRGIRFIHSGRDRDSLGGMERGRVIQPHDHQIR